MRDFYQILGVDRSADARDIRAAYLDLMKRFHPDRPGRGGGRETRARDINLAFSVLRDEARRAQYDLELTASEQAMLALEREREREAARRRSRALVVQPRRARIKGARAGQVLLALAVLGSILFFYEQDSWRPVPRAALDLSWDGGAGEEETAAPVPRLPSIDPRVIADAVADYEWIATQSGLPGLRGHAGECWIALRQTPSFDLLNRCAAFDIAADFFVQGSSEPAERSVTVYFSQPAREGRYRDGLARIAAGADPLPPLARVEDATVAAMVDRVARRQGDPAPLRTPSDRF